MRTPRRIPLLPVYVFLVAAITPLLFRLPIEWLKKRFTSPTDRPTSSRDAEEALIATIERILRRGHPFVRKGCLTRGFTLFYFLRLSGVPVDLVFGMGEIDGSFEGHCWLEKQGEPFLESRDPRPTFTRLYAFR